MKEALYLLGLLLYRVILPPVEHLESQEGVYMAMNSERLKKREIEIK
jgi:hypothetical protein